MGTIYLLSPITVISLKAIDLNNRGWNVVTPSDRMLSIILAESEHLDNHEVLATEREPEGPAQRSNLVLCIRLAPLVGREHFVVVERRNTARLFTRHAETLPLVEADVCRDGTPVVPLTP